MTTPKRIPIPRDLKPGDVIVDNHGEELRLWKFDGLGCAVCVNARGLYQIFRPNGYRVYRANGYAVHIIRIIRKAIKPTPKTRVLVRWVVAWYHGSHWRTAHFETRRRARIELAFLKNARGWAAKPSSIQPIVRVEIPVKEKP